MSWNDVEITPKGKLRYEAIIDECRVITSHTIYLYVETKHFLFQYRKDAWAMSILEYSTDKPQRLPIIDIGVRDVGEPNQAFWIEIGAVCFS